VARQLLDGPDSQDLARLAAEVCTDIDVVLSSDRWRLLLTSSTVGHHIHAAGALRHTAALLRDVVDAVDAGREVAARVLGRAHLEAWIVGMYVMAFGDDAIEDIERGYVRAIEAQHASLAAYDDRLRTDIAKARKRNARIRRRNRDVAAWNSANPDEPPKPLLDEVPVPQRDLVDVDLRRALAEGAPDEDEDEAGRVPVSALVARLNEYGRDHEGPDAVFDMVYDLGYRGLSTLGAHPTLWVLNAYLDFKPNGLFVSSVRDLRAPTMTDGILNTAVLLTATLAVQVYALREQGPSRCGEITAMWRLRSAPA
jgi:hypothetical protein